MPGMTIWKNHPSGLKRWNGKILTLPRGILARKFLKHHCLPLHDHFDEFLMGFSHSTKSCGLCHVKTTQN